jgi:hypothetical protein
MTNVICDSSDTVLESQERRFAAEPNAEDATRSAKNIAQWKCYLPDDCVETMINMGWDRSV